MKKLLKLAIFGMMFCLYLMIVNAVSAPSVDLLSPSDKDATPDPNYFWYLTAHTRKVTFTCNSTPGDMMNVSNISLYLLTPYDNLNNSQFKVNLTNSTASTTNATTERSWTFAVADGTTYVWNCRACQRNFTDDVGGSCSFDSANRTMRMEVAPFVALNSPADGYISNSSNVIVNFTVGLNFSTSNQFSCRWWDNTTGNWSERPDGYTATNYTNKIITRHFDDELAGILWNIRCREFGGSENIFGFGTNKTITIDVTAPEGTLSPANATYKKSESVSNISVNLTETNAATCSLYGDFDGTWKLNDTKTLTKSGVIDYPTKGITNGNNTYTWNVVCNDSTAHSVWISSTNYTFIVDTRVPEIKSIVNNTARYCDRINVTILTDNVTNATLFYGTTVAASNSTSFSTSFLKTSTLWLDFGNDAETTYYYNVTYCDEAGNCNQSNQYNFITPVKLCTGGIESGWSIYAILNWSMTLGRIANESSADYIYYWNQTNQSWIYHQRGTGTNSLSKVIYGDAVFLYTATNTSWFRPRIATYYYNYSLVNGYNFLGIGFGLSFYNLTLRTNYSFKYFGAYNNTEHNYYLFRNNMTWNNATVLNRGDVFYVYNPIATFTWNGTAIN